MANEIRIEERNNQAASLMAKLWPDYPQPPKTYKVFVRDFSPKDDVLEVDCDYIERKYGAATIENARKYFEFRDSIHDSEEQEILDADNDFA